MNMYCGTMDKIKELYLNSRILITDDDGKYGYIVSESSDPKLTYVFVDYWSVGEKSRGVYYLNRDAVYEKAKSYVQSQLVDYSESHRAQNVMMKAYIEWYEKNNS